MLPDRCRPNRVHSGAQPDSSKSTSQAMFDKTQRASDRDVHGGSAKNLYDFLLDSPLRLGLTAGRGREVKSVNRR